MPNTGCTVTAAAALQGLEELRKAEVKVRNFIRQAFPQPYAHTVRFGFIVLIQNTVSRYVDKITYMEQQLQHKMNEELKLLMEEKQTKSRLKQKLIESSITEEDLVVSKMVSKIVEKYQQEKLVSECTSQRRVPGILFVTFLIYVIHRKTKQ